jgi:hypothetical protein
MSQLENLDFEENLTINYLELEQDIDAVDVESESEIVSVNIPEDFPKILNDFIQDILLTFPEYEKLISTWWSSTDALTLNERSNEIMFVFNHCAQIFPERFFDILYKKVEMFELSSSVNTEFLPGIVFKYIWTSDISEHTRSTIWRYLQLLLFSIIGTIKDKSDFGSSSKMFDMIDSSELKTKLHEAIEGMQSLFTPGVKKSTETSIPNDSSSVSNESFNPNVQSESSSLPDVDQLHEHLSGMMGGTLGKLAMELAEETACDFNLDFENATNPGDVFQSLFKDPSKIMGMVKNISSKLDEKLKAGDLKETEIMEEGMGLLDKMKSIPGMPGMDEIQRLFKQMGGNQKGAKMDMNAMETRMKQNLKNNKIKERIRAKAELSRLAKSKESDKKLNDPTNLDNLMNDEDIIKIFSTGEKVEKSLRGTKNTNNDNGKKKKQK